MRDHTDFHVEFIDAISDEQAEYEREAAHFSITTF
ncbi:MAG: DNA-dependent RNA polymerase auxiliary subunit epsilon family protein [Lactococcus sp.]|nr:DNA-dependent RNA polymerase auxiliary subunit epsilon family protein [Lactococcus sp.]MDN6621210.1 DNA-dependent RNA polymerase auxiliary subunit epsilon family protein [Lactococcus sp.]